MNRDEAARLRAMIAPPLALDAGAPSPLPTYEPPAFDAGSPESYGHAISTEPTPLLDAFLDAPRAEDPFSDPPPLVPVEPIAPFLDAPAPHAALDPIAGLPADPFAPMTMDVDIATDATDMAPIADVWTPEPLDPAPADVDAFTTLRPDPFARADAPAEPALRVPDPDPDGIVIDLPDPMPLMPDDTLSPIIPDRDRWVTMDIEQDAPVTPIAWRAATLTAPDAAMPPLEAPMATDADPSIRLRHAGSGWEVGGLFPATAMADDGALSLRRADTRWALSDLTAPGDVTAEAVVDFTAGAGFGILFRAGLDASGDLYGYSFDLDPVSGSGAYVVRQWEGNRPHWRPLAHTQVLDPTRVLGRRTICLAVLGDSLTVHVDGETVVTVPSLSHASIELGRQPCRGDRLGIQAAATAEVTVSRLSATQHVGSRGRGGRGVRAHRRGRGRPLVVPQHACAHGRRCSHRGSARAAAHPRRRLRSRRQRRLARAARRASSASTSPPEALAFVRDRAARDRRPCGPVDRRAPLRRTGPSTSSSASPSCTRCPTTSARSRELARVLAARRRACCWSSPRSRRCARAHDDTVHGRAPLPARRAGELAAGRRAHACERATYAYSFLAPPAAVLGGRRPVAVGPRPSERRPRTSSGAASTACSRPSPRVERRWLATPSTCPSAPRSLRRSRRRPV